MIFTMYAGYLETTNMSSKYGFWIGFLDVNSLILIEKGQFQVEEKWTFFCIVGQQKRAKYKQYINKNTSMKHMLNVSWAKATHRITCYSFRFNLFQVVSTLLSIK